MRRELLSIHPASTAKLVARDIDVSQRTVENWLLLTSVPSLVHFDRMVERYGFRMVVAAFPALAPLAPLAAAGSAEGFAARAAASARRSAEAHAIVRGQA